MQGQQLNGKSNNEKCNEQWVDEYEDSTISGIPSSWYICGHGRTGVTSQGVCGSKDEVYVRQLNTAILLRTCLEQILSKTQKLENQQLSLFQCWQ